MGEVLDEDKLLKDSLDTLTLLQLHEYSKTIQQNHELVVFHGPQLMQWQGEQIVTSNDQVKTETRQSLNVEIAQTLTESRRRTDIGDGSVGPTPQIQNGENSKTFTLAEDSKMLTPQSSHVIENLNCFTSPSLGDSKTVKPLVENPNTLTHLVENSETLIESPKTQRENPKEKEHKKDIEKEENVSSSHKLEQPCRDETKPRKQSNRLKTKKREQYLKGPTLESESTRKKAKKEEGSKKSGEHVSKMLAVALTFKDDRDAMRMLESTCTASQLKSAVVQFGIPLSSGRKTKTKADYASAILNSSRSPSTSPPVNPGPDPMVECESVQVALEEEESCSPIVLNFNVPTEPCSWMDHDFFARIVHQK